MVGVRRARARLKARRMRVGREMEEVRHAVSRVWRFGRAEGMVVKIVEVVDMGLWFLVWVIEGWRRVCWQFSRLLRQ